MACSCGQVESIRLAPCKADGVLLSYLVSLTAREKLVWLGQGMDGSYGKVESSGNS
jgi:hypothetical protein